VIAAQGQDYYVEYWISKTKRYKLSEIERDTIYDNPADLNLFVNTHPEITIVDTFYMEPDTIFVLHEGGFAPTYYFLKNKGVVLITYHGNSYRYLSIRDKINDHSIVDNESFFYSVEYLVRDTEKCPLFLPKPSSKLQEKFY
jgi:hypothetical protein